MEFYRPWGSPLLQHRSPTFVGFRIFMLSHDPQGQDAAVVGIEPSGGNLVGVLIYQTTYD